MGRLNARDLRRPLAGTIRELKTAARVQATRSPFVGTGFTAGSVAQYVPIQFAPTDLTSGARQQPTTSTSFVALFEHYGLVQNPGLSLTVEAWASDGTTSATIQVFDVLAGAYLPASGSVTPQAITVPTATTSATPFTGAAPFALAGNVGDDLHLELHVKRTAGSGTVYVAVARSIGSGL